VERVSVKRITAFRSLDIFRGLAALWVVMDHSASRWLFTHLSYGSNPLYAFSVKGPLGVVIFFVISGYCITGAAYGALVSGKTTGRYAFERIRRIYPPYLAALVLTLASGIVVRVAEKYHLIGAVNNRLEMQPTIAYWAGNLFLLQFELKARPANIVFWSLCYEVAFYAIVGVVLVAAKYVARRRGAATGIMVLVSGIGMVTTAALVTMLIHGDAIFPFDMWHQFALGALLFFCLELNAETVKDYSVRLRNLVWANAALVAVLTVLFVIYCSVGAVDIGHPSSKWRSSMCLVFCAVLIGLRRFDHAIVEHRFARPWLWLGAFSYSLYLAHTIILPYVDVICRKAGLDGNRYIITYFIEIPIAIAFGRLFFVLIERRFISKKISERLATEHVLPATV